MAPPITYTRSFQHQDWIDNTDRVQAGGSNGFNIRFHSLEAEFDQISQVVAELNSALTGINAALTALNQPPAPTPQKQTLRPNLVATSATGWNFNTSGALKAPGQTSAHGMQPLMLPQNSVIQSLRVTGTFSGAGSGRVTLYRQDLSGTNPPGAIIGIMPAAIAAVLQPGGAFDVTQPAVAAFAAVDNGSFAYYIEADLDNSAPADAVAIYAFQIAYLGHS